MEESNRIFTLTIQRGSIGQAVASLQTRLNALEGREAVTVDGVFGPETEDAVKRFQEARGLPVNGTVDHSVWLALQKKRGRNAK